MVFCPKYVWKTAIIPVWNLSLSNLITDRFYEQYDRISINWVYMFWTNLILISGYYVHLMLYKYEFYVTLQFIFDCPLVNLWFAVQRKRQLPSWRSILWLRQRPLKQVVIHLQCHILARPNVSLAKEQFFRLDMWCEKLSPRLIISIDCLHVTSQRISRMHETMR